MEGEVVAEEQDGGPGGEDEGGVDLFVRSFVSFSFSLVRGAGLEGTYGSQSPVEDRDQAFDRGRGHGEGIFRCE